MPDHSKRFPGKEEMERSLQKLSKDLKETQQDRDKVVQELKRLKQHLLEKVLFFLLMSLSLFSEVNQWWVSMTFKRQVVTQLCICAYLVNYII